MTDSNDSPDCLLGIDLGTTVLKVAAFDAETGAALATAAQRLAVRSAPDGTREQNPKDIDAALASVLASIKDVLGARFDRVSGIGLAAQGGSAILADRKTGTPHTPMMLWNDSRPMSLLPKVAELKPLSYWRELALRDRPGVGLARMLWFRERYPDLFTDENIYIGAGEYLYFKLTGVWRQDAGNALQIGCYDAMNGRLDEGPLDLIGVPISFVAPMRNGHETHSLTEEAANRLGLKSGTHIAGPYMDHEAGYMSSATSDEPVLQCSLGTAWVGNVVLPEEARTESPIQLVLPSPVCSGRLLVQPLLAGNAAWDWGLETLVDKDHSEAISRLPEIFGKALTPPAGLVAIPWTTQLNPFADGMVGGGVFTGINAHTSREDLLRAVAAGLVYEMARVFQAVIDSGDVKKVVLGGGASKGEFFTKMLATLWAPLSVGVSTESDLSGPRGALFAFSEKVAKTGTELVPLPCEEDQVRILEGYRNYLEVFEMLYGAVPHGGPVTIMKGSNQ